jgi:hypothetical protein
MLFVEIREGMRIEKHSRGTFEGYPMLSSILPGFRGVPFEVMLEQFSHGALFHNFGCSPISIVTGERLWYGVSVKTTKQNRTAAIRSQRTDAKKRAAQFHSLTRKIRARMKRRGLTEKDILADFEKSRKPHHRH